MGVKVAIRADASTHIGLGHVMRCLTLAEELKSDGHECLFICREQAGCGIELIREQGHKVEPLPPTKRKFKLETDDKTLSAREALLGATQSEDARLCLDIIKAFNPHWLVVDHYSLGARWEGIVRKYAEKLMVIDDLADRRHECDILLDQNYTNRLVSNYAALVSPGASILLGAQYALVRREFAELREKSLKRRKQVKKENVLVFMGGSDPDNDTGKVIRGFLKSTIIEILTINVVIGSGNPNREYLKALCSKHKNITLHIQISHMVSLMVEADCAIVAGGSTTWERCVLGLPALVVVQSKDQLASSNALNSIGAHKLLGNSNEVSSEDYLANFIELSLIELRAMSEISASICDGGGSARVAGQILRKTMNEQSNRH